MSADADFMGYRLLKDLLSGHMSSSDAHRLYGFAAHLIWSGEPGLAEQVEAVADKQVDRNRRQAT